MLARIHPVPHLFDQLKMRLILPIGFFCTDRIGIIDHVVIHALKYEHRSFVSFYLKIRIHAHYVFMNTPAQRGYERFDRVRDVINIIRSSCKDPSARMVRNAQRRIDHNKSCYLIT